MLFKDKKSIKQYKILTNTIYFFNFYLFNSKHKRILTCLSNSVNKCFFKYLKHFKLAKNVKTID